MDWITPIVTAALTIFGKIIPDKTAAQEQAFKIAMQQMLADSDLAKAQLSINQAEANNPNRHWMTWRELLGYVCVAGASWAYFFQPVVTWFMAAIGHPVSNLPPIDVVNMMGILSTMLGAGGLTYVNNKQKQNLKK